MRNSSILTVAFLLAFGLSVATAQVDCGEDFTTKDDCRSNRKEHGCRWLRKADRCVHKDIECTDEWVQRRASCNKFDHCEWNRSAKTCIFTNPSKASEAYGVEAGDCQTQSKERCFEKPKKDYRMHCVRPGEDYKCDYDNRCHARAAKFRRRDCQKVYDDEGDGEAEEDGEDYDGEDEKDSVLYIREEDIACDLVDCMEPKCVSDEIVVTPDEECCPICVVGEDEEEEEEGEDEGEENYDEEKDEEDYDEEDSGPLPYLPAGDIDCSAVACREPKCASDENLETPGGECCPQCAPVGASACLAPDNSECKGEDEPVTCDGCYYDSPCHAASAGYLDTSSCN